MDRKSILSCMRKQYDKWIMAYLILFFIVLYFLYWNDKQRNNINTEDDRDHGRDMAMVRVPIRGIMSGEPIQLPHNDRRILDYIWHNHLIEPPSDKGYQISDPKRNPSRGQGQLIQRLFENMTNGFFVEAGALDGETRSNTMFLELHLGWKGLLIEADPSNYALLKTKNRKAWTSNTCLAIKPYPHQTSFEQNFNIGKIMASNSNPANPKVVTVQCIPLFTLLSALNVTTVDYFSLDVEGYELQVLKTIPFDQIFIKTLSVEFIHTSEGKYSLREYMEAQGYKMIQEIRDPFGLANDFIFVHSSVMDIVH